MLKNYPRTSLTLVLLLSEFFGVIAIAAIKVNDSWPLPTFFTASNSQRKKAKLTIPFFINYSGYYAPIGASCPVQIQVALDAAQKAGILSDYDVVIRPYDEMCDPAYGTNLVLKMLNSLEANVNSDDPSFKNLVPMTLGPLCNAQVTAINTYRHFNFILLSTTALISDVLRNRRRYDSFYLIGQAVQSHYRALPLFLASNGWKRVYLLTETESTWLPWEEEMLAMMANTDVTLTGISKVLTLVSQIPASEMFQLAVDEMAVHDPRVVIVNSRFGSMLACWLHRRGLYGPKYVYVSITIGFFLPNSMLRAVNCTDRMLFEVLQSFIFYGTDRRSENLPGNEDSLGVSWRSLTDKIWEDAGRQDKYSRWYTWKTQPYDTVAGGLQALHAIDKNLKTKNDSLLNWVTSSENFRKNGSYIHSVMKETLETFRFNGMGVDDRITINSLSGFTSFQQAQKANETSFGLAADYLDRINFVRVAAYDTTVTMPAQISTGRSLMWQTPDGQPPYDSLRVVKVKEPAISRVAQGVLLAMAALELVVTVAIFAINEKSKKNINVANSLPVANSMILVANFFMLLFVLVMISDIYSVKSAQCVAGSLAFIVGFTLLVASLHAKMEVAASMMSFSALGSNSSSAMRTTRVQSWHSRKGNGKTVPRESIPGAKAYLQRVTTVWMMYAIAWTGFQLLIAVIWFGIEPIVVQEVNRRLFVPNKDISLAYQFFTETCAIKALSNNVPGFVSTLAVCYALIAIRSLYLAVILRKGLNDNVSDIHCIKMTSYATTVLAIAGGVVLWLFFGDDNSSLLIALSVLALLIVTAVSILIFAPKIRRGIYF